MRIQEIKISNFRRFSNITIPINDYSCFVGPNGAGKSTVLCALNIFFREQSGVATDVLKLSKEDFFHENINDPIRVTLTFNNLSEAAVHALDDYVRQDRLVVTAEATYDETLGHAVVQHYGQRNAMQEFRRFFDAEKAGAAAADLNVIYASLQQLHPLPNARSKPDKIEAIRSFEADHPELCILIASDDNFYGINSTGKLSPFIQWIYVPAVKDISDESQEAKNSALSKLINRTIDLRLNFDAEIERLKLETRERYQELLASNQVCLSEISASLQRRLGEWSHPDARLGLEWISDPLKSVVVQQPIAGIRTGDAGFYGSLSRMGHGLQRSYLLALLQELAAAETDNAPTLILAIEEPELYQHPPQARHLSDVLEVLSSENNQILVTTHSPLFIKGDGFEDLRLITATGRAATAKFLTFENLCNRIRNAAGAIPLRRNTGLVAKIHQALQPNISEMFFAKLPIFVEGLEDVSYLTTYLQLRGSWNDFRGLGCHFVAVHGKDKLIQPIAMAKELEMPFFLIFDADGNITREEHRQRHQSDNRTIYSLLEATNIPDFPADVQQGESYLIWPDNMGMSVKSNIDQAAYQRYIEQARRIYCHEGGLEKHDLFIAEWLSSAYSDGIRFESLERSCQAILDYAVSL